MSRQVLFIQGGGNGGYEADAALASSLQEALGKGYDVKYHVLTPMKMRRISDGRNSLRRK
jgi:hypothetical protein